MSMPTAVKVTKTDLVDTLNACIEVCVDAEKAYAHAAADARYRYLKGLFFTKAADRKASVVALQAELVALGACAGSHGSSAGAVRRDLTKSRLVVEGRSDRLVVEEWIRAERCAQSHYEKALARTPLPTLPTNARMLLQGQYREIQNSLEMAQLQLAAMT
ncbi:MAG: PA2169 family four-helix-bundle protein [Polyangiaceae bacterium]